jgi:hypothetical protein
MRLIALAAAVIFVAGSAMACPMHTAGKDQTVAQSSAPAKKLPQSQPDEQG